MDRNHYREQKRPNIKLSNPPRNVTFGSINDTAALRSDPDIHTSFQTFVNLWVKFNGAGSLFLQELCTLLSTAMPCPFMPSSSSAAVSLESHSALLETVQEMDTLLLRYCNKRGSNRKILTSCVLLFVKLQCQYHVACQDALNNYIQQLAYKCQEYRKPHISKKLVKFGLIPSPPVTSSAVSVPPTNPVSGVVANPVLAPLDRIQPPRRGKVAPSGYNGVPPAVSAAPLGQMSAPPGQMSAPLGQMSSPPGQMSSPPGQMSAPPGQMSAPPGQMSAPPGQMSLPPGQMSAPPGQMSAPPGQMSAPPGQMSVPPGQMSAPAGQISVPPGQMSAPPGQMSAPPGQMSALPGHAPAPRGHTYLPPGHASVLPGAVIPAASNTELVPNPENASSPRSNRNLRESLFSLFNRKSPNDNRSLFYIQDVEQNSDGGTTLSQNTKTATNSDPVGGGLVPEGEGLASDADLNNVINLLSGVGAESEGCLQTPTPAAEPRFVLPDSYFSLPQVTVSGPPQQKSTQGPSFHSQPQAQMSHDNVQQSGNAWSHCNTSTDYAMPSRLHAHQPSTMPAIMQTGPPGFDGAAAMGHGPDTRLNQTWPINSGGLTVNSRWSIGQDSDDLSDDSSSGEPCQLPARDYHPAQPPDVESDDDADERFFSLPRSQRPHSMENLMDSNQFAAWPSPTNQNAVASSNAESSSMRRGHPPLQTYYSDPMSASNIWAHKPDGHVTKTERDKHT